MENEREGLKTQLSARIERAKDLEEENKNREKHMTAQFEKEKTKIASDAE